MSADFSAATSAAKQSQESDPSIESSPKVSMKSLHTPRHKGRSGKCGGGPPSHIMNALQQYPAAPNPSSLLQTGSRSSDSSMPMTTNSPMVDNKESKEGDPASTSQAPQNMQNGDPVEPRASGRSEHSIVNMGGDTANNSKVAEYAQVPITTLSLTTIVDAAFDAMPKTLTWSTGAQPLAFPRMLTNWVSICLLVGLVLGIIALTLFLYGSLLIQGVKSFEEADAQKIRFEKFDERLLHPTSVKMEVKALRSTQELR